MGKQTIAFAMLIMVSLLFSVESAPLDTYCGVGGVPDFSATPNAGTLAAYDAISYYTNTTMESIPILIQYADGTNSFKMRSLVLGADGTFSTAIDCNRTKDYNFVSKLNEFLFLKNPADGFYYYCQYSNTDFPIIPIKLNLGSIAPFTSFD